MAPNRSQRIKVAKETLDILENGSYLSESYRHVTISSDIRASVEGAIVYSSTDLEALRKTSVPHNHETSIKVVDDFVVSCILKQREALGSSAKIACLNFASAKNVCGGMVRGSLAQEESLGKHKNLSALQLSCKLTCRTLLRIISDPRQVSSRILRSQQKRPPGRTVP